MLFKKVSLQDMSDADQELTPMYSRHVLNEPIPCYDFPNNEILPRTAYSIIHDELMLEGNSRLNLATFVTTWMEPEARLLMSETFDKNMIDKDEYPQTAALEMRCVNMIARLWSLAGSRGGNWLLHHWLQRGLYVGRVGAQVEMASTYASGRQTHG